MYRDLTSNQGKIVDSLVFGCGTKVVFIVEPNKVIKEEENSNKDITYFQIKTVVFLFVCLFACLYTLYRLYKLFFK